MARYRAHALTDQSIKRRRTQCAPPPSSSTRPRTPTVTSRRADRLVRDAAARGAEARRAAREVDRAGHARARWRAGAQPLDGAAITWARAAARELGHRPRRRARSSSASRTARRLRTPASTSGPTARSRAVYRKIHMFDVEVDGVDVRRVRQRGGRAMRSSSPSWPAASQLGMSDLLRPALSRAVPASVRCAGAEVIAVPAAFTLATTRDHWEVLLRARAIENQCFVVAANQIGDRRRRQPRPAGAR